MEYVVQTSVEHWIRVSEVDKVFLGKHAILVLVHVLRMTEQAAEAQNLVKLYTNNMVAGFQQNGDFDGMIAAAEQMLASEPENAVALKIRVQAYEGKKDLNKVIELAEAAALAQTDAEDASFLYYLLGSAYNAKEMKPQAIAALQKVTAGPSMEAAQAALAELTK